MMKQPDLFSSQDTERYFLNQLISLFKKKQNMFIYFSLTIVIF